MNTVVTVVLIILPILATIIIGISIERVLRRRGSWQGRLLQKYLNDKK